MKKRGEHRRKSGSALTALYRRITALNMTLTAIACIVAAFILSSHGQTASEALLRANASETLSVQTETLVGTLDRYRLLPTFLSDRPDVIEIFLEGGPEAKQKAGEIARRAAGLSGAADVKFLNTDATLFAGGHNMFSDTISENSRLIQAALQGRLGREVRTIANGRQAYVFSSAVRNNGNTIGIIAVYVGLDELEWAWTLSANPILAISDEDVIVISNRTEWRQLKLADIRSAQGDFVSYSIGDTQKIYIDVARPLPLLGWKLCVLVDTAQIKIAGLFWGTTAALFFAGLGIISQLLISSHKTGIMRKRSNRATALHLERLVRDRTSALQLTNSSLAQEIESHRRAEQQLRKTQDELLQSGKLAALGQMSTALSHEYNQPLAAIKSYAENALTYLDRHRTSEAKSNISSISLLTDRMAEISKHLKNFARKPNQTIDAVPVKAVIEDAISVLAGRINAVDADITISGDSNIYANGGHIRLQQVMVNLLINALDAMEGQTAPLIEISMTASDKKVTITVADNGPGIDESVIKTIFDPFMTTKEIGKGLGLGLSISYNIIKDFGGKIKAKNRLPSGAEFAVILNLGEQVQEAAE